jgi:hypothetical protein
MGEGASEVEADPIFTHPSLTIAHPAREVRGLKQHGVGEGEGDLGQILLRVAKIFVACLPQLVDV